MYPALDEKFVMGPKLAGKVLFREVPSQEFSEKKDLEEFWLVNSASICGFGDVFSNKGTCLSELNSNGMVRWGVRRQVRFIGKHRENHPQSSPSFVEGEEKAKEDGGDEEEDREEDGEEERDDDEEAVTEEVSETKKNSKRKRNNSRLAEKTKKARCEKQRQSKNKTKNNCKQIVLRNPKDRWSAERYKLAEQNLVVVMKAKGAVYGNPILRPELRAEARKRIGDTGLLDHLLKHMAGKVAPGGTERFRRRHNADGAMEYWLESADLVNIRKDAGVHDPYWTPPPGWKPGDCPTQDPICARQLKLLKEEISKIERDMEEMVSKKHFEEEMAKLRREMEEMVSKKQQEESQAIVVSNPCATSQKLDFDTSLLTLKSDLDSSMDPLENCKEQLMVISNFLSGMEEKKRHVMSKVEEGTSRSGSALIVSTESYAEKEKKQLGEAEKGKALAVQQEGEEGSGDQSRAAEKRAAEEKAAKKQRLKSGFRICKPQGTFLWPNMVNNNNNNGNGMLSSQVVVQVEDLFVVPTPPSVSSSTASSPPQQPYHHHPASPVKPLAEKRAVTVTVSTIAKAPTEGPVGDNSYSTTTTTTTDNKKKTTSLINLNDFPTNVEDGFCGTPSSQQTVTTTTVMPRLLRRDMTPREVVKPGGGSGNGNETKYMMGNSKQQQRGCSSSSSSCLSMEVGTWLASGCSPTLHWTTLIVDKLHPSFIV
ncbi:hypothetical protein F0562_026470 [Nyssa sinensis]|uniref:PTC1-like winged helix-turn-helix domain-containing protein n=1 Tax=Nyssa sinensis TaxID=561372 RepID=A0A5J5BAZ9_9ASTE|nr:hypothetical protein F0562_026470 [Nyssa sinensis]